MQNNATNNKGRPAGQPSLHKLYTQCVIPPHCLKYRYI